MRARAWLRLPTVWLSTLLLVAPGCPEPDDGDDDIGSDSSSDTGSSSDSSSDSSSSSSDSSSDTGSDSDSSSDSGSDGGSDSGSDTGGDTTGDTTGGDTDFAEILGDCGLVAAELDEPTPSLFTFHLDFRGDPYDPEDLPLLTEGAQTILTTPNAGGSSTISEAFAYEILARCEGAMLLKTETEIGYDPIDSKKTDFLIELAADKVGVSVTRAVGFPPEDPYPPAQADSLMTGKLGDILISSANVVPEDQWVKQILVVMAYADMHAELIQAAWTDLDPMIKADTIVYVVITDGMDTPVYFE